MQRAAVLLGTRVGPFEGCLDLERLHGFAAATRDPSDRVRSGDLVPPVALVTQVWKAQNVSRAALIPEEFQRSARGGVHGEHDLVLHRPIVPGEPLWTWVEGHGARRTGANSVITLRYTTVDALGAPVAEQLWSTVWLGVTCEDTGEAPPGHAIPGEARQQRYGSWQVDVEAAMARDYAEVSGDWSPHHFDVDAARQSGADGPFLHGLCTMALCAQAVSAVVLDGDARGITRIAVRFAKPVLLGERLVVDLYDAGSLGCAFEATAGGATVITQGRAEYR